MCHWVLHTLPGYRGDFLLDLMDQCSNVSGRSCPESHVISRIDIWTWALLCCEDIVQDLVELPVSKVWAQEPLFKLSIAVGAMLVVGFLELFLIAG